MKNSKKKTVAKLNIDYSSVPVVPVKKVRGTETELFQPVLSDKEIPSQETDSEIKEKLTTIEAMMNVILNSVEDE